MCAYTFKLGYYTTKDRQINSEVSNNLSDKLSNVGASFLTQINLSDWMSNTSRLSRVIHRTVLFVASHRIIASYRLAISIRHH
jgi:hypothetical protein